MRTHKHVARKARIIPTPFTFQCTCCEIVEHRRTPSLPEGWQTEELGEDIYAYCPECAVDLPGNHLPKGQIQ